jgi:hypothetical protein
MNYHLYYDDDDDDDEKMSSKKSENKNKQFFVFAEIWARNELTHTNAGM